MLTISFIYRLTYRLVYRNFLVKKLPTALCAYLPVNPVCRPGTSTGITRVFVAIVTYPQFLSLSSTGLTGIYQPPYQPSKLLKNNEINRLYTENTVPNNSNN